ncbi:hypothetical protein [Peterkaempfera griseoplana]|uniref:hypothetical protein n=1 Tax=Peterkaempfera griseoplana TaxID=66896 RepID=UPI0012FE9297|nr:hypothetical protein [Peterkaempfera griseoplana]
MTSEDVLLDAYWADACARSGNAGRGCGDVRPMAGTAWEGEALTPAASACYVERRVTSIAWQKASLLPFQVESQPAVAFIR